MEGLLEGGGTRNASTRVADKVGWPANWWPMLVRNWGGMTTLRNRVCRRVLSFALTSCVCYLVPFYVRLPNVSMQGGGELSGPRFSKNSVR
jgi:hypothetical protein